MKKRMKIPNQARAGITAAVHQDLAGATIGLELNKKARGGKSSKLSKIKGKLY